MSGRRKLRRPTQVDGTAGSSKRRRTTRTPAVDEATTPAAAAAAAAPHAQIRQLDTALKKLKRAETAQAAADAERAEAVQMMQDALPAVETMVRDAAKALSEQAVPTSKALQAEQIDAQERSSALVGDVRTAISTLAQQPATGASLPVVMDARRRGKKLMAAAATVSEHIEQLHATLAASAAEANDGRSLVLRVLGIDQVRDSVMANFSLRQLFSVRRTCKDFERWFRAEIATSPPIPVADYGRIELLTFDQGKPVRWTKQDIKPPFPDLHGACLVRGADGSIYLAGGRKYGKFAQDLSCHVSVWRPAPLRGGKGQWYPLPSLPAGLHNAKGCVVTMGDGEEVLVLLGGDTISEEDDAAGEGADPDTWGGAADRMLKVRVLRNGSWSSLKPTAARDCFSVCPLSNGRLAIVGGETWWGSSDDDISAKVEVLDIARGTWTDLPAMSQGRLNPGVVEHRQSLFVLGGACEHEGGTHHLQRFSCEQLAVGGGSSSGGGGGGGADEAGSGDDASWTDVASMSADGEQSAAIMHGEAAFANIPVTAKIRNSLVVVQRLEGDNLSDNAMLRVYDYDAKKWFFKEVRRIYSRRLEVEHSAPASRWYGAVAATGAAAADSIREK
jgi:hypothetical protein